jgi:hypothetical protein
MPDHQQIQEKPSHLQKKNPKWTIDNSRIFRLVTKRINLNY